MSDAIETALDGYWRSSEFAPKPQCYISGEFTVPFEGKTLYTDEGLAWCRECAEGIVANAAPHLKTPEDHKVIECDGYSESDTSETCHFCGAILTYTLTEHGVAYEADHYEQIRFSKPLKPSDAYAICRMLLSAPEDAAVKAIAKRAAKALP